MTRTTLTDGARGGQPEPSGRAVGQQADAEGALGAPDLGELIVGEFGIGALGLVRHERGADALLDSAQVVEGGVVSEGDPVLPVGEARPRVLPG